MQTSLISQDAKVTSTPVPMRESLGQANLNNLPLDIMVPIFNLLWPEEFEAVTMTSKHIYNIAAVTRLPTHRELKSRYWSFEIDRTHPAELIHAIWKNRAVADYVRKLLYVHSEPSLLKDRTVNHFFGITQAQIQECIPPLRDELAPILPTDLSSDVAVEKILCGHQTPAFCYLLCLLPRLEHLTLSRTHFNRRTVLQTLRSIIEYFDAHPKLVSSLGYLQHVHLSAPGPSHDNYYDATFIWAVIPWLTTITGVNVTSPNPNDEGTVVDWYYQQWTSNVTRFELSEGYFKWSTMHLLLRKLKALRVFRYSGIVDCAISDLRSYTNLEYFDINISFVAHCSSVAEVVSYFPARLRLLTLDATDSLRVDNDEVIEIWAERHTPIQRKDLVIQIRVGQVLDKTRGLIKKCGLVLLQA